MVRRRTAVACLAAGVPLAALALTAGRSEAGPEKVRFPAAYRDLVLYTTVDRYDIKQHRELYTTPQAVEAAKAGRPLPHGSVVVLVQHKAQVDDKGVPVKDARGRFVKGEVVGITAMEKQAGFGAEYAETLRNGEWEYAAFRPDGTLNDKADHKACFACHKPHEKIDFVISYGRMAGRTPTAAAAQAASPAPGQVVIAGFAFAPARVTVPAGQPVVWLNTDDSPHQVTLSASGVRSEILPQGLSTAHAFDAPGSYDYACGLHPSMKGTVEVTK